MTEATCGQKYIAVHTEAQLQEYLGVWQTMGYGDSVNQTRGAFFDVMNRNFVRRLHHHAMTAHEQGMFLIDKHGVIRNVTVVGPIDPVPGGAELAELARARCGATPVPA